MEENIIFSNTHGFQIKRKEIYHFLKINKPIAFLVAEHFQSRVEELWLTGYDLAAQYCRGKREKGGVAIFVRNGVHYKPRPDLDRLSVDRQFETASIEIPSKNVILTVVYRSPKGSLSIFDSRLENTLKIYNLEYSKKHVIAGDFNINKRFNEFKFSQIEQLLTQNGCKFTLTSSTHKYGGCLDNFIVDFESPEVAVMAEGFSDHRCIKLPLDGSNVKTFLDLQFDPWKSHRSVPPHLAIAGDSADEGSESEDFFENFVSHLKSRKPLSFGASSSSVDLGLGDHMGKIARSCEVLSKLLNDLNTK